MVSGICIILHPTHNTRQFSLLAVPLQAVLLNAATESSPAPLDAYCMGSGSAGVGLSNFALSGLTVSDHGCMPTMSAAFAKMRLLTSRRC